MADPGESPAGTSPDGEERVAWAPGRVNLVGEHIDYHGLSVLPMALRRGVRLRFRPIRERRVVLTNSDPAFPPRDFPLDGALEPGPPGDWGNYLMAGALTVLQSHGVETGIEGEVNSDLPPAAGLSSSSALVVATALALLNANGKRWDPLELADALAQGERFVGTAGGGMDQAASLNGVEGHALRISFGPLAVEPVPFPSDWTVLVAHSGVRAEKSGPAQVAYNQRREGSARALTELSLAVAGEVVAPVRLLEAHPLEELVERCRAVPGPGGSWAVHALTEAGRVASAVEALGGGDLAAFGSLLDASHASLRDVYGVSHPRLDALVEAAREAGAAGARLTGAGFGGCVLAVCRSGAAEGVLEGLARAQAAMDPPPELAPFRARPGGGARILESGPGSGGSA